MKKIDLHIHTVCTPSDIPFVFSPPKLIEYVRRANLDGIAVTNHNCFDARQFKEITAQLDIPVFPGIELVVDGGHLLLLSDVDDLADFDARCRGFGEDAVGVDALRSAFGDLSRYLIIPHYEKKPAVSATVLSQLGALVSAGEVASPKKFRYCINDPERLVPVYFSDIRIQEGLATFPTRQTYISAGDVSLSTIKFCLRDKDKVFLSERDGHRTFDALDNGMKLSTGLNVILGERSTGKTYTLDRLSRDYENVKYIKQFSLLELDEESEVKRFNALLSQKQSLFTQDYLREFKEAVDGMVDVDTAANERKVERYLSSLLTSAKEVERADAFSKAQLFGEVDFSIAPSDALKSLISAVESLIENTEYRSVIQKHVPIDALRSLIVELMSKWAEECELNLKKRWLNDLIGTIRKALQVHTAAPVVEDVDFYQVAIDRKKVERFQDLVRALIRDRQIHIKEVQGFSIVARTNAFRGAAELRALSGRKKTAFAEAFKTYEDPYSYLRALSEMDGLEASEYYKYFVSIDYRILNKHGFDVSGGERSEFNLLQEINGAQQYDMLLIDEPESSFDNLFLRNDVNELIKVISRSVPTVVVTHNNSVGASIKPDYVVFTQRTVADGNVRYRVYSGYASDKDLVAADGQRIKNIDIVLDCLEAGELAYDERGDSYEILKD